MADFADAPTSSVVLDPAESLSFQLQAGASPQAALSIRNISESRKIAFKVKTTRPMRYLVRPNQGMLGPNMSATIMVILQQKDCDELLRLDPAERQLSNDKFLVQSSYVDDSFYEAVKTKSPKEMADELTTMWNKADKRALANKKLRCRFTEDNAASDAPGGTNVLTQVDANAPPMVTAARSAVTEDVPHQHQQSQHQEVSTPEQLTAALLNQPPKSGTSADADDDKEWTVESVAALKKKYDDLVAFTVQMAALKKKYDDLVAFTVQMTASRQSLMNDLERTKAQLEKEKNRKDEPTLRQRKPGAASATSDTHAGADHRAIAAKDNVAFGLYHLLVCAIVFFLIGRFY